MSSWTDVRDAVTGGSGGSKLLNIATMGLSSGLYPIGIGLTTLGELTRQDWLTDAGNRLQEIGNPWMPNLVPEQPGMPSSVGMESGSPTYSLTAKGNRKRVGEPIPIVYGRMRIYPDLIEDPHTIFGYWGIQKNAQWYYAIMCIGHGTFSPENGTGEPRISTAQLPTDAVVQFQTNRSSFTVFDSGDNFGLTDFVRNMSGANGQTVTTTNTDAQASATIKYASITVGVEVDVVFPGGLFDGSSGSLANRSVTLNVKVEEYNGATLINSRTVTETITEATRSAVRRSLYAQLNWLEVDGNTLKVSVYRSAAESTSTSIVERCQMVAAKMYRLDYATSGTSLVGLALRASENINGDLAGKFSVLVTRKLPIWNGTAWSAPTATRSISWALADILRDTTYGAGLSDDQIDLAGLLALDAIWTARGDYFDGVFDQTVTTWEALERVARCGRARPVIRDGVVTFIRDESKTTPVAIFTPSNIVAGSLSISYRPAQEDDEDGIDLTYIDPATWAQEHAIYQVGGGTPLRPRAVTLFGCTDAAMALREATYLARKDKYQRKAITWTTEMDGRLVTVGDLVSLSHDVPDWGQSGEIIDFIDDGVNCRYRTTQELDFSAAGTKYVMFRKPDGTVSGPHAATASAVPWSFRIADPGWVPVTDLSSGDRTSYLFGPAASYRMDVVITGIVPRGRQVEITAVPYDARIHAAGA